MAKINKFTLFTTFSIICLSARLMTNKNNLVAADSVCYEDDNDDISTEEAQQKYGIIYPGTKWCGTGDIANNYDDLGTARETDMCCREHDNCPDLISAGETKYNLTNRAFYTRLNCACDEKFRQCLRNADSSVANRVGKLYFNSLRTKCYREDYPIKGCLKRGGFLNRRCLEYEYDTESEKIYQWFEVNRF